MFDEPKKQTELSVITQRVSEAEDFVKAWHDNIKKWRKLYNLDHYKHEDDPNGKAYVDPTHTNTVDLAVGILQSNAFTWNARGLQPSSAEEEGSSIVEKAINGIIDSNAAREQIDPMYEVNLNFVRDGGACIYSYWDKDVHDTCYEPIMIPSIEGEMEVEVESREYYELPLRTEVVDPLQVILLPGGTKRWLGVGRRYNGGGLD